VAIAWLSAALNSHGISPVGLMSIGLGVVLGVALFQLAQWQGLIKWKMLLWAAVLLTAVNIVAQHAWLYQNFRSGWRSARAANAQVAMFRPEEPWSPREYLQHELQAGSLPYWCLDAIVILISTLLTLRLLNNHNQLVRNFPTPDT
jgi:hypothetical protein